MGREAEEENIEVDFVEGRFALPFSAASTTSPKRIGRESSQRKKKNLETTETTSYVTPSAETSDADADDDDDQSSTWSGTQRAGSLLGRQTSWSALIAGYEDDIPRTQVEEGKVCLVGGTVIIRGIRRDEERQAIQKVLQLVVSAVIYRTNSADLAAVHHPSDDSRAGAARRVSRPAGTRSCARPA
jgi:1-phosphatidylinositol-3-phosphate 5-kinase